MRIDGPGPLGGARPSSAKPTARGSSTFSLVTEEPATEAGPTRAATAVAGLDAMLALQGVDDPLARRRRALRRGHRVLDALDRLKIGLLEGALRPADISRVEALAREEAEVAGDPALDAVLGEIDLRAQVEAAKLDRARRERKAAGAAGGPSSP